MPTQSFSEDAGRAMIAMEKSEDANRTVIAMERTSTSVKIENRGKTMEAEPATLQDTWQWFRRLVKFATFGPLLLEEIGYTKTLARITTPALTASSNLLNNISALSASILPLAMPDKGKKSGPGIVFSASLCVLSCVHLLVCGILYFRWLRKGIFTATLSPLVFQRYQNPSGGNELIEVELKEMKTTVLSAVSEDQMNAALQQSAGSQRIKINMITEQWIKKWIRSLSELFVCTLLFSVVFASLAVVIAAKVTRGEEVGPGIIYTLMSLAGLSVLSSAAQLQNTVQNFS